MEYFLVLYNSVTKTDWMTTLKADNGGRLISGIESKKKEFREILKVKYPSYGTRITISHIFPIK